MNDTKQRKAATRFAQDTVEINRLLDAWAIRRRPMRMPEPPEEVLVGELDADGWAEWKPIPSPATPADVDALERATGVRLPPFYRAFLCSKVLIDLDFGAYNLPPILPHDPLRAVEDVLRIRAPKGYLQFGDARGCGDPLCFDLGSATPDEDYGVVVFNHDVVPPEVWSDAEALRRYAGVVAPSFREFLTCLLTDDPRIVPPPESPEELRRNVAWERVRHLAREKGLPPHFRPAGISPTDPWAIAEVLARMPAVQ